MQDHALLISSLIDHAAEAHPQAKVVSHTVEGPIHRCIYGDIAQRAKQLANALTRLGVQLGERIGPPRPKQVKAFISMTDRQHLTELGLDDLLCYEELIAAESDAFEWPALDGRQASSMCYTTGNPKGVFYSHRSSVLHSQAMCSADGIGLCAADTARSLASVRRRPGCTRLGGWQL